MKLLRVIAPFACMAVMLAVAPLAQADTITGSVWENGTTSSVPVAGSAIYSTTPTVTVTISNSNPASLFNFYSGSDSSLNGFLTNGTSGSNGDTVTYTSGSKDKNDGINDDLFQFSGSTTLANGTYTFSHDDGLLLYLNGNLAINAGGQTSAVTTDFTVCAHGCDATAGTYSFTLDYAEVAGPPAQLVTDLPLTGVTPEPSSFILLGTGLLAAAGAVRRRMAV